MQKFIPINQLFLEILTICYFRAFETSPGMPDQTQQKLND